MFKKIRHSKECLISCWCGKILMMLKDFIRDRFFKSLLKTSFDEKERFDTMNDYIVIEIKKNDKIIDGRVSK